MLVQFEYIFEFCPNTELLLEQVKVVLTPKYIFFYEIKFHQHGLHGRCEIWDHKTLLYEIFFFYQLRIYMVLTLFSIAEIVTTSEGQSLKLSDLWILYTR